MSKIGIIIQREYTSRVMKKSFLLLTFLTPIFMAAMIVLPLWITSLKDDTIKSIVVVDKTKSLQDVLTSNEQYTFIFTDSPIDEVRKEQSEKKSGRSGELTAVLYVTDDLAENTNDATSYSEKQIKIEKKTELATELNHCLRGKELGAVNELWLTGHVRRVAGENQPDCGSHYFFSKAF